MKALVTLTAAALATTAFASSAFAESIISCDSALSTTANVSADNCREWGIAPPRQMVFAPAYAYAPRRAVPARSRAHRNRTGVHGGAGN
jgi:hypothetical protein